MRRLALALRTLAPRFPLHQQIVWKTPGAKRRVTNNAWQQAAMITRKVAQMARAEASPLRGRCVARCGWQGKYGASPFASHRVSAGEDANRLLQRPKDVDVVG